MHRLMRFAALILTMALLSNLSACGSFHVRQTTRGVEANDRPNIIVIIADDLGYADISAGPYRGWVQTPALDRMAREGLSFVDFHTNSSVCSPTRAAFMTGRYQQRVGIVDVIARHLDTPGLNPSEFTVARMMKNRGYATALFGKWHLGGEPQHNPIHHGFDEFRGYLPGAIDYHNHKNSWYNGTQIEDQPGYVTHRINENALRFIETHRDEPFFLCVTHEAVHHPFQTPDDTPENRQPVPKDKTWDHEYNAPKYTVMLQEMDKGIGQILDALERHQLSERTLVIFFSDNGATNVGSNKPWRGGKFSHYEGGHRVPAIAWWPGRIAPGRTTSELVVGMDLLPTIAAITGAEVPADRALDGMDVSAVLLEGGELPPRRVFFGYEPKLGTALRDGDWKAILKEDHFELYNLASDPGERTNIAEQHADRARDMRQAIEQWRDAVKPVSG